MLSVLTILVFPNIIIMRSHVCLRIVFQDFKEFWGASRKCSLGDGHLLFEMAHYPRWGGSNVDSSAMLSAYFDWTQRATEQELQATVPHLWLVEHRAPGLAQPLRVGGITIPSRRCTIPACNRCKQLRGGYQFRWIDARWLDKYEMMRRPESKFKGTTEEWAETQPGYHGKAYPG